MILIPYFGRSPNPQRLANLRVTYAYYRRVYQGEVKVLTTSTTGDVPPEADTLRVDDSALPAPSKSFLVRRALEQLSPGTDVLFADTDMLLAPETLARFFATLEERVILKPHWVTLFLTAEATAALQRGEREPTFTPPTAEVEWPVYYNQGGAWGLRTADDLLAPLASPTLFGWGVEDSLLSIVGYNLGYDTVHFDDAVMLHLWHPLGKQSNSSAEHNARQALDYLRQLHAGDYRAVDFRFTPQEGRDPVDDIDAGVYRCDRSTLFNHIGDHYFRTLGYSHHTWAQRHLRPGRTPHARYVNRPRVTVEAAHDSVLPRVDLIYRRRYPDKVPTAVPVTVAELLASEPLLVAAPEEAQRP